jgi:hypothetical protein
LAAGVGAVEGEGDGGGDRDVRHRRKRYHARDERVEKRATKRRVCSQFRTRRRMSLQRWRAMSPPT